MLKVMDETVHRKSRLYCIMNKDENKLFFSLVDYRNNYFTSNDLGKIIEFYEGFENRDQLIQWMRERPKGVCDIREVEGDKDIIVVIPTADFNGKYARECRENIFKGLHMVFVESGVGNYYFNYAHNCNVGIKRAMEYNPKWIVVSNDDMYKVDEPAVLRNELLKLNENEFGVVFTQPTIYHSKNIIFSKPTFIRRLILMMMIRSYKRSQLKLEKKLGIKIKINSKSGIMRFLYKPILVIRYTGSFGIFSSKFISSNNFILYDEVYINGIEDLDLGLLVRFSRTKITEITYSIKDIIGGTIGPFNSLRMLRALINQCYFNYKFVGHMNDAVDGQLSFRQNNFRNKTV